MGSSVRKSAALRGGRGFKSHPIAIPKLPDNFRLAPELRKQAKLFGGGSQSQEKLKLVIGEQ